MPTYQDIVRCYRRRAQERGRWELSQFGADTPFTEAIRAAALCELPNGKRHPHQYRIPTESLKQAAHRLLLAEQELRGCKTFDELYRIVESHIRDIWMIGELVIYDVAHRIGKRRGLSPDCVYLHRGTRRGAKALGLHGTEGKLMKSKLPVELSVLSCEELEDCLCIFSKQLAEIVREGQRPCRNGALRCPPCLQATCALETRGGEKC